MTIIQAMFSRRPALWIISLLWVFSAATFSGAHASTAPSDLELSLSLRASSPEGTFANIQRSSPGQPLIFEVRFGSTLTPTVPPPFRTADIYFGGILPGGQVFSWVEDDTRPGNLKLVAGYVPVNSGFHFEGPSPLPIVTDWSRRAEHRFGPADALGSYFLFTIAVGGGKDPTNPDNWILHDSLFVLLRP